MIRSKNTISVYEVNGESVNNVELVVQERWNNNRLVVLEVAGKKYTVAADDLRAAITNATNCNR